MQEALHTLQHNLQVLGPGRALARLADALIRAYPDPYSLARSDAQAILQRRTGKLCDPDQIWWHQFESASTSPRTFNGFAHYQRPVKSMRFAQLMLERFDPGFQEASDELDLYGGFYRQGPDAGRFDEHNEVPVLARDIQADFWALDFGKRLRRQVERFWQTHGDAFQVLAKVSWLAQCASAQRAGHLDTIMAQALRGLVAPGLADLDQLPTLALLRQSGAASDWQVSVHVGQGAGPAWMYLLRASQGQVVLYLPNDEQPLRAFDSTLAMAHWLREHLRTGAGFARMLQQMAPDPGLGDDVQAARSALRELADSSDAASALALLDGACEAVSSSLFEEITTRAERHMRHGADLLTDNHRLREAMFGGYLAVTIRFACYFAPLTGGLGLLGAALGVVKLGIDLDLASHARTRQQRDGRIREALMDAIFTTLNMLEVSASTLSSHAALAYQAPFHEADAALGEWREAATPLTRLQGQEANELLGNKPLGSQWLRGVRVGEQGQCWIELDGLPYRVRYSSELGHWLIVDPDNPFAFAPLRPVRLDAAGRWRLLEPPRLAGGMLAENAGSEPSAFWDEYMRRDTARSTAMAEAALARHRALLEQQGSVAVASEAQLQVDGEGFSYADDDGVPEYTFEVDGEYRNGLIEIYTADDAINDYLRQGTREFSSADEVSYLHKLADSMELLPRSTGVPLFRGGHGVRGTSGAVLRGTRFEVGTVLVNTDLSSWTENPYMIRGFAADPGRVAASGEAGVFDDTSVVFELPAGAYRKGVPISAFSTEHLEAETLFLPGSYFRIEAKTEIAGADYRFLKVSLREVDKPSGGVVYDLRSGEAFDRAAYTQRLGDAELVERFFGA